MSKDRNNSVRPFASKCALAGNHWPPAIGCRKYVRLLPSATRPTRPQPIEIVSVATISSFTSSAPVSSTHAVRPIGIGRRQDVERLLIAKCHLSQRADPHRPPLLAVCVFEEQLAFPQQVVLDTV